MGIEGGKRNGEKGSGRMQRKGESKEDMNKDEEGQVNGERGRREEQEEGGRGRVTHAKQSGPFACRNLQEIDTWRDLQALTTGRKCVSRSPVFFA